MKDLREICKNRIDLKNEIDSNSFLNSILDITSYMTYELTDLIVNDEENYDYFQIKTINNMNGVYSWFNEYEDEDIEVFEKITYLLKPAIIYEFKRLKRKKLSASESIIIIIKKIIDLVIELNPLLLKSEIKILKQCINRLFYKIYNKSKKDLLFEFQCLIKDFYKNGYLGKYRTVGFELTEENTTMNNKYQGSISLLDESGDNSTVDLQ